MPDRFQQVVDSGSLDLFVNEYLTGYLDTSEMFDPEDDEGHVEYKWRLVDIPNERLDHLISQMKFRIHEGSGSAIYRIGVKDNGESSGLTASDLFQSTINLMYMTRQLGACLSPESFFRQDNDRFIACFLVTISAVPASASFIGRVAILGDQGSGKTTMIGSIISNDLDDGKGSLRNTTCKFIHELLNGGMTCAACPYFWNSSAGTIEFVDFPGSSKYRKNLLKGLTAKPIDLIIWTSENDSVDDPLRQVVEQQLQIPCIDVRTKCDLEISSSPIQVSTVTGSGLEELRSRIVKTLTLSPPRKSSENLGGLTLFSVQYLWQKTQVVVGGVLERGVLSVGSALCMRSSSHPEFTGIFFIKNIRDSQGRNVHIFSDAGQVCSLGLEISSPFDDSRADSPTASPTLKKRMRPFAILVTPDTPLTFSDRITVRVPRALAAGEKCMLYWRGIRTEAVVCAGACDVLSLQLLRRAEFFGCDFQVLLEVLPGGEVLGAQVIGSVDYSSVVFSEK